MLHVIVHPRTFARRFRAIAAIPPRHDPTRPILETVQFAVGEDGHATLRAKNLDCFAVLSVPLLKLHSSGVVQLPLEEVTRALKDDKGPSLSIEEQAPQRLALTRGANSATGRFVLTGEEPLITLQPEAFPVFEEVEPSNPVQVAAWRLRRLIAAVVFATDPHSTRFSLGGVAVDYSEGRLSFVATDGHRLAHATEPASGGPLSPAAHREGSLDRPLTAAVNGAALRALARLLEAGDENSQVQLAWSCDGCLHVQSPGMQFRACQLEGRYPAWREVVPPLSPHRAEVRGVTRFQAALDEARERLDQGTDGVVFRLLGSSLFIQTAQGEQPDPIAIPVLRPEADSGEVACVFDPRCFEGWTDVVRSFVVELPEASHVPAVFRSDGLDFYVMPVSLDEPAERAPEQQEAVRQDEGLQTAIEQQDGRDENRPGPPDDPGSLEESRELSPTLPATSGVTTMAETSDQGTPRKPARQRGGQTSDGATEGRAHRPVRTIRMGRIRAAIWANQTDSGMFFNTTFERIYKPDGEDQWKSSDSFGPNDLLLLAKVADQAHPGFSGSEGRTTCIEESHGRLPVNLPWSD